MFSFQDFAKMMGEGTVEGVTQGVVKSMISDFGKAGDEDILKQFKELWKAGQHKEAFQIMHSRFAGIGHSDEAALRHSFVLTLKFVRRTRRGVAGVTAAMVQEFQSWLAQPRNRQLRQKFRMEHLLFPTDQSRMDDILEMSRRTDAERRAHLASCGTTDLNVIETTVNEANVAAGRRFRHTIRPRRTALLNRLNNPVPNNPNTDLFNGTFPFLHIGAAFNVFGR